MADTLSPSGIYAASVALVDGNAPGDFIVSGSVSQANGAAPWVAFSQDFTATSDLTLLTFIARRVLLTRVSISMTFPSSRSKQLQRHSWCSAALSRGLGFVGYLTRRKRGTKQQTPAAT